MLSAMEAQANWLLSLPPQKREEILRANALWRENEAMEGAPEVKLARQHIADYRLSQDASEALLTFARALVKEREQYF